LDKELSSGQKRDSQRGSVDDSTEPRFLVIGQVVKPHGVRGEVRVTPHTELPERFTWLETVYVGKVDPQLVTVEDARLHKSVVLLKLAGYDDRDAAESLRGQWLQIPEEEGIPLQEGEYYLYQLEGLLVYSEAGERLGELVDVIETKANNVFVVQGSQGEILLPDIDDVIKEIDFENGRMTVHLLPGLLP
jgi:16S rRNA processing protein RimM